MTAQVRDVDPGSLCSLEYRHTCRGFDATTIDFHRRVLAHPEFVSGNTNTHFIDEHFGKESQQPQMDDDTQRAIVMAAALYARKRAARTAPVSPKDSGNGISAWTLDGRRRAVQRWPAGM